MLSLAFMCMTKNNLTKLKIKKSKKLAFHGITQEDKTKAVDVNM